MGLVSPGIQFALRGGENDIDAVFIRQGNISFQASRVSCQILPGTELSWINKDAGNEDIPLPASLPHQRQMAFVQVTHRGDKDNGPILLAQVVCPGSHLFNGLYDFDGGIPFSPIAVGEASALLRESA